MPRQRDKRQENRVLLESRLAYHLRCLREDAADPAMTSLERLALVRDRTRRIREVRQELKKVDGFVPARRSSHPC